MKKLSILTGMIIFFTVISYAQVGINTDASLPDPSAMLDIKSDTAGILIPRMTAVQRDAINNPATGLMVFVTDNNTFNYFDGNIWKVIGNGDNGSSFWSRNGNTIFVGQDTAVVIGKNQTTGDFEVSTRIGTGTYSQDVTTGGTVTAQEYQGSFVPENLFDDNQGSLWRNDNNLPVWIQYDFGAGNEKTIGKYRLIWMGANYDFTPYSWEFLASDDGTNWTVLDTRTGQNDWQSGTWKEFVFSNSQNYRYYRLNITDNNGQGSTGVYLNEMEMMEEIITDFTALYIEGDKAGIGTATPDASAALDIQSTDKGILIPRMTAAQRDAVASPATGLMVYVTDDSQFYYYDGTSWLGFSQSWQLTGNAGTTNGTDFIGTTDNQALDIRTNDTIRTRITTKGQIEVLNTGQSVFLGEGAGANDDLSDNENVFIGHQSGYSNTTGLRNTANGSFALYSNTTGPYNTANGSFALYSNSTGVANVAIGHSTMYFNTTGEHNTANGQSAMYNNTTGGHNTATGYNALYNNTTGGHNTATGYKVMYYNTSGEYNTATGYYALYYNTTGYLNTATGYLALYRNSTGSSNVAMGISALFKNTDRSNLVAVGDSALFNNGVGVTNPNQAIQNTALGSKALYSNNTGYKNTASGYWSLYSNTTGVANTANGYRTLYSNTTGWGNVALGEDALYSNTEGHDNSALGKHTLFSNTTGDYNTANGIGALFFNTTGFSNVAMGTRALYNNTDRSNLVAVGDSALFNNGVGASEIYHATDNTAVGSKALYSNTRGYANTATGSGALYFNTTGDNNTANGRQALRSNTTGSYNSATGKGALYSNTTGVYNTATGSEALYSNTTGDYNTATGNQALNFNTTGSNNTALGRFAFYYGTSYNNSTALGYNAAISASNQARIGNSSVTSIGGYAAWTNLSDGRFKTGVQENVPGMDLIKKLRPVTYHLDMDKLAQWQKTPDSLRLRDAERLKAAEVQIGFIAQEVEQAARELNFDFHAVDKPKNENDRYGLRYAEFVPVLVKALQEQEEKIDKQQTQLIEYKDQVREQQEEIERQKEKVLQQNALIEQLYMRMEKLEKRMDNN